MFSALGLNMPIHDPEIGFWGRKWGKQKLFCSFIALGMQSLGGVTPYQLNSVKIGVVLARGLSKNSVTKK